MEQAWVGSILSQCEFAGVPFFFKQWGGVQKKLAGRSIFGRTYDQLPSFDPIGLGEPVSE